MGDFGILRIKKGIEEKVYKYQKGMKMKKLNILLIIALVFSTALHVQPAMSEQTNFIKRQYNSFRDDVKLIRKCYLKKTAACSDNERAEAKKAAVRVTVKGAALIAAIIGTAVVGYGVYVMREYQKKQAPITLDGWEQKVEDLFTKDEFEGIDFSAAAKETVQAFTKAHFIKISQGEKSTEYLKKKNDAIILHNKLNIWDKNLVFYTISNVIWGPQKVKSKEEFSNIVNKIENHFDLSIEQ